MAIGLLHRPARDALQNARRAKTAWKKTMNPTDRLKRLGFRAWHRGTKEADMMLGGFYDTRAVAWTTQEIDWFEALLEEQDVDIMAWAIGTLPVPLAWQSAMMDDLRTLDFITTAR
jgi:antitoxin CptB